MIEKFELKPRGTIWFGGVFDVEFNCEHPPSIVSSPKFQYTKCKQLGFIISQEYDVPAIYIEKIRKLRCDHPECNDAIYYEIDILYRVSEKIGLGFGLGGGTGTAGWTFNPKDYNHTVSTRCICCDAGPLGDLFDVQLMPIIVNQDSTAIASVLFGIALLIVILISAFNPHALFSLPLLYTLSSLTVVAAASALVRHVVFTRVPSVNNHLDHEEGLEL
ncbi:MAG: hypothetical protein GXP06_13130 [Alphaproteobacteria bacterium]|nr:hypothetical protein [Alphaproteobacteria bacterium]